jgi:hypothetical protein
MSCARYLLPTRLRSASIRSFGNGEDCSIRIGLSCTTCAALARNGVKSTRALQRTSCVEHGLIAFACAHRTMSLWLSMRCPFREAYPPDSG